MIERIAGAICVASILVGSILCLVLIWGPQSPLLGNLASTCLMVFLASATIFSVRATLRTRRDGG